MTDWLTYLVDEDQPVHYIVVDYDTPDLAQKAIKSMVVKDPAESKVRCVSLVDAKATGVSYAEAINRVAQKSDAPIICACNADVEMLNGQQGVIDLLEDEDVAVVGVLQYDADRLIRHAGIVGTNDAPTHRFFGDLVDDRIEQLGPPDPCVTVSGSVYFARRDLFVELGGFLETPSKMYFEETWYSYLVRHRGYKVMFDPSSHWLHHWDSSLPVRNVDDKTRVENQNRKSRMFAEARDYFRLRCAEEGIVCD